MKNSLITKLTPGLYRIVTNIGWLTVGKFLQMGAGILAGAWVARYLGPERYGLYNYASAFVALFGSFTSLGLAGIVVRDIVRHPENKGEILGTTFVIKLFGGFLSLIVITILITARSSDWLTRSLVIVVAIQLLFGAFDAIHLWFESEVQSKYVVLTTSSARIIGAAAQIILILLEAPLISFAWVITTSTILEAIGSVIVYQRSGCSLVKWRFSMTMTRKLLGQSWILILSGLAAVVNLKIDQLMLREMIGPGELGIYSSAVKLSEAWYFVPGFIAVSVFPALIRSKNLNLKIYQVRLQQLLDLMFWVAFSVAILVTFFSSYIILLFYGEAYTRAGTILSIHIWACVFVFFGEVLSKWLINEEYLFFSIIRHGVGAVVNVGLNLLLIPWLGGLGAAIATLVSYAVASYLICFLLKKTRPLGIMMTLAMVAPFRIFYKILVFWRSWEPRAHPSE